MDVFPLEPTPAEVLKKIYKEFKESGELRELGFEDFVQLAHPNIVILTPEQVQGYLKESQN